ncbi:MULTISPECIES: carbohydrate ABC transporter permease [unclassified Microbacterium]|uniref:carbohydrate ABC transporter permease n=1 Tax=unclassified Microbacterium TaxID=2609290 RepID=UPI0012F822F5|nr:sugar ABC transporter permease [Microbacterium sp. MAH-37]MVQ41467.1 ABC transporter permease subunit [Microbacterium sp. MAH-37]
MSSVTQVREPDLGALPEQPERGRPASPHLSWRTAQKLKGASFTWPFFAGFALFTLVPVVMAFQQSLFSEKSSGLGFGGTQVSFTGLENFARGLSDDVFWESMLRVGVYAVIVVPLTQIVSLTLALLVDAVTRRVANRFRLSLLIPYMIPGIVATMIWIYLYSPAVGPFQPIFDFLGLDVDFFSGSMIWVSIGNLHIWGTIGFNMLILYGALQAVPRELFDAARVDGASELRIALSIKVPYVRASLVLTGLLAIIGTLQIFAEPMLFRSIAPEEITKDFTPAMVIYNQAFQVGNLNYAAALSIILAAVVGIASAIIYRLTNKVEQ